jgi:hypothetical protein
VATAAETSKALLAGGGSDEQLAPRFAEQMRRDVRRELPEHEARAAELAAPFDQLWGGLSRYWQKKSEKA